MTVHERRGGYCLRCGRYRLTFLTTDCDCERESAEDDRALPEMAMERNLDGTLPRCEVFIEDGAVAEV